MENYAPSATKSDSIIKLAGGTYNPDTDEYTVPAGYLTGLALNEYSRGYGEGLRYGRQKNDESFFNEGFATGQKSGLYLGLTIGFSLVSVLAVASAYLLTH